MNEPESTSLELQEACTDASLISTTAADPLNVMDGNRILSSNDIGEGNLDPEEKSYDGADIGKDRTRVPVVALDGTPLMPCTATKARRLLESGEARYKWNKLGMFYLVLNYMPRQIETQPMTLGIDPGSKFEGYSVVGTEDNLANLMTETKTWIKKAVETRKIMRRARRFRNTRIRKCKSNRKKGKHVAPSTRARVEARVEIARQLGKIIPIKTVAVEDVKAASKKGKSRSVKKWNTNFSALQVGKQHMYSSLRNLGFKVKLFPGYETKAIRDKIGLKKSRNKSKPVFETHCLDAWAIASKMSGAKKPTDRKIIYLKPIQLHRRQLHALQFSKGSKRRPYGGTISKGIKRGTLVRDSVYGLCYVGGESKTGVSLHSYSTGDRIARKRKVRKIKTKVGYTRLPPQNKFRGSRRR
jgi:hypothetical protein